MLLVFDGDKVAYKDQTPATDGIDRFMFRNKSSGISVLLEASSLWRRVAVYEGWVHLEQSDRCESCGNAATAYSPVVQVTSPMLQNFMKSAGPVHLCGKCISTLLLGVQCASRCHTG